MSMKCGPARRDSVSAVWTLGRLIITARGKKPSPCYEVKIEQSPLKIYPPAYIIQQCLTPGSVCADVVADYRAVGVFHTGPRESVTVYHHDGHDVVKVHIIEDPIAPALSAPDAGSANPATLAALRLGNFVESADPGEISSVATSRRVEATGYSSTFSFTEAFQEAVSNLPPDPHPYPDKLTHVTVDAIGADYGGIVGFHRLVVRVSTYY